MASRFKGVTANSRHLGFWQGMLSNQIVCRQGHQRVILVVKVEYDAGDLKWTSTQSSVATADWGAGAAPGELLVEITGHSTGQTVLTLWEGSFYVESIFVYVYPAKTKKVNFYRVNDGNSPNFSLSQVGDVLKFANSLFKYQANVVFESHLVKSLSGAPDFSARAQSVAKQAAIETWLEDRVNEHDSSSAHLNVFCVKKFDAVEGLPGVTGSVFGATVKNVTIVEDMGSSGETNLLVAHELGHALSGKASHSSLPGSIMRERPSLSNRHIFPQDVVVMRGLPA